MLPNSSSLDIKGHEKFSSFLSFDEIETFFFLRIFFLRFFSYVFFSYVFFSLSNFAVAVFTHTSAKLPGGTCVILTPQTPLSVSGIVFFLPNFLSLCLSLSLTISMSLYINYEVCCSIQPPNSIGELVWYWPQTILSVSVVFSVIFSVAVYVPVLDPIYVFVHLLWGMLFHTLV